LASDIFNLHDHDEIRWVKLTDLANYELPEADRPIVEKLIMENSDSQTPGLHYREIN
jgi:hypothetical protein